MIYVIRTRAPDFAPEAPVHRLAGYATGRAAPDAVRTRCGVELTNSPQRATRILRERPRSLAFCQECRRR